MFLIILNVFNAKEMRFNSTFVPMLSMSAYTVNPFEEVTAYILFKKSYNNSFYSLFNGSYFYQNKSAYKFKGVT